MIAADKDWVPEIGPATANAASIADGWRSRLLKSDTGKTIPCLANAITALRHAPEWEGVLGFNEFSLGASTLKPAPWGGKAASTWTDQEDRLTADWLQHNGIMAGLEVAGQAAQTVAHDRRFHPVRQYLDSLAWDGIHRIDQWLDVYLGVEHNKYAAATGARWLISAVARIYRPGAKADCCLILEGAQGAYKSQALGTLGGKWYTDEIADLGSKDASMQTMGVWIIEIGELDSMNRAEVEHVKLFMSRSTDRFRPPYARHVIESPRQCIFAGTVNKDAYLRDETGARRFWPVRCRDVRREELARDRDQLWAEACRRFHEGSIWWLDTPELNQKAEQEQLTRYDSDAWDALILPWAQDRLKSGSDSVSVGEVLELCIGKSKDKWERSDQMRVGRCLVAGRWERYRDRKRGMEWRYRHIVPNLSGNTDEAGNA